MTLKNSSPALYIFLAHVLDYVCARSEYPTGENVRARIVPPQREVVRAQCDPSQRDNVCACIGSFERDLMRR